MSPRTLPFGLLVSNVALLMVSCGEEPAPPATPDGPAPASLQQAIEAFQAHYRAKWSDAKLTASDLSNGGSQVIVSSEALRPDPGNHPKILHHGTATSDVLVIFHGVTDSPHYVEAIGRKFHEAGWNVVLPLLHAHASRNPLQAMRELHQNHWIADVNAMVHLAQGLGQRISLGGFSTGGALVTRKAALEPNSVNGGLFLFSAALDIGTAKQRLLESEVLGKALASVVDTKKFAAAKIAEKIDMVRRGRSEAGTPAEYGIGADPYKYSVFFIEGAAALAEIIQDIDEHYEGQGNGRFASLDVPVFVAHSRTDKSAKFRGAQQLIDAHPGENKQLMAFDDLAHSSLVLADAIGEDPSAEDHVPANPKFEQMAQEMLSFAKTHVAR